MDVCDACNSKSLMPDYFGDICLCKRCSIKLLSPTWKNKEYSTNEEVDKQAEKIISIACKYSYPEKLIEGLHGFFDSKRIEGLYCKLNGGCGQKITVCCDRIVINTNEDFDVKEIGKAYKRMCEGKRGAVGIGDFVSAEQAAGIVSTAIGGIIPGGGLIKSGIKALGRGVASNAIAANMSPNVQIQRPAVLNVSSGDRKIYFSEYDVVTFMGPIDEEEYGFIRFQSSQLLSDSSLDIVFCFMNTKNKVNKANEICSYIQSRITTVKEEKMEELEAQEKTQQQKAITKEKTTLSVPDEILKYKELFDLGAITEEEFVAKKKQLLGL